MSPTTAIKILERRLEHLQKRIDELEAKSGKPAHWDRAEAAALRVALDNLDVIATAEPVP